MKMQPAKEPKHPFVSDIQELRRRARQHMEQGAVTSSYTADRETVIRILNEVLATETVCVLRYKRHDQEYKMPGNVTLAGVEIPFGLGLTTLALGFVAIANLFSKQIATQFGLAFTLLVFTVFTVSERISARKRKL